MLSTSTSLPSQRHLTDVAFRFGPSSPVPAHAPAPPADGPWTLDDVLGALDRGAGVFESRTGLRLRHAHRRPGLAAALKDHAPEVRMWLELAMTARPVEASLRAWPLRVRLYVTWLDDVLLASDRELILAPGVRVRDRAAFRTAIQSRVDAGPGSAAATALAHDLSALFERYGSHPRSEASPSRRIARAA